MPGSPTFSTEAARVLVDAYLAQPEGSRDLRRVLALSKQWAADPSEVVDTPSTFGGLAEVIGQSDPSVVRELAGMSKSQAYELLRQDPRYQPSTSEQAEELSQRNLDLARRIIDREEAKDSPDWPQLKHAQRLVNLAKWGMVTQGQAKRVKAADGALTGLLT